jgi:hypothetical protein
MANNSNNNNDGDAIEGWNTLANQIGSIFVFDVPDWRSDEGKRTRTKLEGLLVGHSCADIEPTQALISRPKLSITATDMHISLDSSLIKLSKPRLTQSRRPGMSSMQMQSLPCRTLSL